MLHAQKSCAVIATVLTFAAPVHASVQISSAATKNMNCDAGVCSPTAKQAMLSASDLESMLAVGDVKIVTGSGAVAIGVRAPVTWTSSSRLTLDANLSLHFYAPVTVAGHGAITLVTNDGGSGGDLVFDDGGNLTFSDLESSLVINSLSYQLVDSVAELAAKIAARPSGNYALAINYDASQDGTYAHPPVPAKFSGSFDGLGHSISNLSVDTVHSVGLFCILEIGVSFVT